MTNSKASGDSPTTIRVLLVEDNPGDARLIREILRAPGDNRFDLHHVTSLKAAREYLALSPADVVLLDLSLPGSSGVETVIRFIESAPDVPIIVLTGTDVPRIILEIIKLGAKDYFVKSRINQKDLVEAVIRVKAS